MGGEGTMTRLPRCSSGERSGAVAPSQAQRESAKVAPLDGRDDSTWKGVSKVGQLAVSQSADIAMGGFTAAGYRPPPAAPVSVYVAYDTNRRATS
jgi:hypothetical protein